MNVATRTTSSHCDDPAIERTAVTAAESATAHRSMLGGNCHD